MTAPITIQRYTAATGRAPITDELDRANCARAGELGHTMCGWCHRHDLPRTFCGPPGIAGRDCVITDEFAQELRGALKEGDQDDG